MSESIDQALENWWQFKTRNVIAEAEARGEAKGEARGERKGAVAVLSRRVDDGLITVKIADEKAEMTEQGFLKAAECYPSNKVCLCPSD